MTARPIPTRHWRSYGTEPLPTGREALEEPFRAFPSWFMRVTCDRCGQQRMFSETHAAGQRDMLIRDSIARMRHDGCGGRAGKVELLTGIEGASSTGWCSNRAWRRWRYGHSRHHPPGLLASIRCTHRPHLSFNGRDEAKSAQSVRPSAGFPAPPGEAVEAAMLRW
jgi:hypothetical protein